MSILLSSYHLEFLAGNGWKCSILIWNQLFLKEEGPFFTFPSKSHFQHFWLFFPILAYISLSVIDNMVPFYTDAHILFSTIRAKINSWDKIVTSAKHVLWQSNIQNAVKFKNYLGSQKNYTIFLIFLKIHPESL